MLLERIQILVPTNIPKNEVFSNKKTKPELDWRTVNFGIISNNWSYNTKREQQDYKFWYDVILIHAKKKGKKNLG